METVINEHNELIATRVPPGDRWQLVGDVKKQVWPTLTDVLEAYLNKTGFKGEYRLDPLSSKLYAIQTTVGNVDAVSVVEVSGIALNTSVGSVIITGSANVSVTGISLNSSIGNIAVTPWSEVDLDVNNTWTEVDLAA